MKIYQDNTDAIIQQLGLEAQVMEDLFANTHAKYCETPIIPGKPWYAFALENNDQDVVKDKENKNSVIQRLLKALINFIKHVIEAISSFLNKFDEAITRGNSSKAEEICKRNKTIDFANSIVEKLPIAVRETICAIEENNSFVQIFNDNIRAEQAIILPRDWEAATKLDKSLDLAESIEQGVEKLQEALREAAAKDDTARDVKLHKTLKDGLSINGSENGNYLKVFASAQGTKKKYEQMLELASKYQDHGKSDHVVKLLQKVGGVLSKQVAMEVRVFTAYASLNSTVISVNNAIHAK